MRKLIPAIIGISLVCLFCSDIMAADFGFKGIGAKVGFVKPEDPIESTLGFGVHSDLGTIVPNLRLEASIEYWSKSYKASAGYGYEAEWSYSDLFLLGTVKYLFPLQNSPVAPYAGGGLGFHRFGFEWTWTNPLTQQHETMDDSETDIGFHGVGGVEYPFSPQMTGFAEVRYAIADPDHLGIYGGITYHLMASGK